MAKRSKKKKPPEALQTKPTQAKPNSTSGFWLSRWGWLIQVLVIALAGFFIYSPALNGGWVRDDDFYFADNPVLHGSESLWETWFVPGSFIEYYPITETVQYFQWHFWHDDTFGYHVTNLLLHITNGFLVWHLLSKFKLQFGWLGGLIFVIHPVQVESVAWITELKNTLSLLPFLLSLCAWIDYENNKKPSVYWLALGWFVIAMLCKVTMLLFPLVILLYAWWKRSCIGWDDLKAAIPFFIVSVVLGTIAISAQHNFSGIHLKMQTVQIENAFSRLVLAGSCIVLYLAKCIWPFGLAPIYPKWAINPHSFIQLAPWVLICGSLYGMWIKRRSFGRDGLLGFGFFLINLMPFVGFKEISFMKITWVMDHLLYIPIIGLIGVTIGGLESAAKYLDVTLRNGIGIIVIIACGLLVYESAQYARSYSSSEALWNYALEIYPESLIARDNLAIALAQNGKLADAAQELEQGLKIDPDYIDLHNNLGNVYCQMGRVSDALMQYEWALRINPHESDVHYDMATALLQTGKTSEAVEHIKAALEIDPNNGPAHNDLGNILLQEGRENAALCEYRAALRIDPEYYQAHHNLGLLLLQKEQITEAIGEFQQALEINPNFAKAHINLATALAKVGRLTEAREHLQMSLQLDPGNELARNNLAKLQASAVKSP